MCIRDQSARPHLPLQGIPPRRQCASALRTDRHTYGLRWLPSPSPSTAAAHITAPGSELRAHPPLICVAPYVQGSRSCPSQNGPEAGAGALRTLSPFSPHPVLYSLHAARCTLHDVRRCPACVHPGPPKLRPRRRSAARVRILGGRVGRGRAQTPGDVRAPARPRVRRLSGMDGHWTEHSRDVGLGQPGRARPSLMRARLTAWGAVRTRQVCVDSGRQRQRRVA
ncbi:hypothetical protein C8Q77DRAFT_780423 [Trametes polyzona]|nr:hypothetical protein C8Q77DRAFT_780423 [Trametes polyzona]